MSKLLSVLVAAVFATASVGSFAMSHGGAPKDEKKMEEKQADGKEMKEMKDMKGEKKEEKKEMKEEKKY